MTCLMIQGLTVSTEDPLAKEILFAIMIDEFCASSWELIDKHSLSIISRKEQI